MLTTHQEDKLDFDNLTREEIVALLKKYQLRLTIDEALHIQRNILQRPLTLSEAVLWSIQGSEHCSYKSSRKYLKQFITEGPNVILGAKEDAGIVSVATDNQGYRYGIVISHESHNHPSQIVPYEGAATGVGGNVRDVCCMGAEVIAIADGLRFGDLTQKKTHWIQEGVISGIAGYGNPIGVPNLAGDVHYNSAYNENCLVTVVTLGVVRDDHVIHSYAPANAEGYVYILVGKPTDNSGFGGASFASSDLDAAQQEKNKSAVQEPNAFLKRHLLKANYALFDYLKENQWIDKVAFKDLGAGGIACASVEMADAADYGAEIYLEEVPTGESNMHPAVILCSETQERFMWVVPSELSEIVLNHYNRTYALPEIASAAQAKVIGKIRNDGQYIVFHRGKKIVNAPACQVTQGFLYDRPVKAYQYTCREPDLGHDKDYRSILLKLLAHENIASRAPITEKYDKQVQGRTLLERDEADAGVMQPFNEDKYPPEIQQVGIALALDQNPLYNKIHPYWGAVNAVIQTARQVTAVGASPQALTDCLCFGNPEKPEQMWQFAESVRGIIDACQAIGLKDYVGASLPVISGNVSLYNESGSGAIPPSPIISCLGQLPDARKAIPSSFQQRHSMILLVGQRQDECGGSAYYHLFHHLGANVPQPDLLKIGNELRAVYEVIDQRLVLSAKVIYQGGLAVALARMTSKNSLGCAIEITSHLPVSKKLFAESGGFILEVEERHYEKIQEIFKKFETECFYIGQTQSLPQIEIKEALSVSVAEAKNAFENGLREKLL